MSYTRRSFSRDLQGLDVNFGGESEAVRKKYDVIKTIDEFVTVAAADGYDFTGKELEDVLRESGDSFESFGNPAKKMIWWF